jgi:hypothetical protein
MQLRTRLYTRVLLSPSKRKDLPSPPQSSLGQVRDPWSRDSSPSQKEDPAEIDTVMNRDRDESRPFWNERFRTSRSRCHWDRSRWDREVEYSMRRDLSMMIEIEREWENSRKIEIEDRWILSEVFDSLVIRRLNSDYRELAWSLNFETWNSQRIEISHCISQF